MSEFPEILQAVTVNLAYACVVVVGVLLTVVMAVNGARRLLGAVRRIAAVSVVGAVLVGGFALTGIGDAFTKPNTNGVAQVDGGTNVVRGLTGTGERPNRLRTKGASCPNAPDVPAIRLPDVEDADMGLVLTRVGTGETFDFAPPAGAEVHADWLAHGAHVDWFYVPLTNGWSFSLGTNRMETLRVLAGGRIQGLSPRFADAPDRSVGRGPAAELIPFGASLGIVPVANWPRVAPCESRVWHAFTPSNTLLMTWQDALFGREATNPVCFQAELGANGAVMFRYGLVRLGFDPVADVAVGVRNGTSSRIFTSFPTNVTSLAFRPLAPEDLDDPDRDGDGLSTLDELFVHGTDPGCADTDADGLSDADELSLGLDPLDPYSNGSAYSDGFARALGGENPFACPEGSTDPIWRHVLYAGTTNGVFVLPVSTPDWAVLHVTATGVGVADLVVDGVPFAFHGTSAGTEVSVPVPKGRRVAVRVRSNGPVPTLAFDSDDFAAGELPREGRAGWVVFPFTEPTPACVHDLLGRTVAVSLDPGTDAENLVARWGSNADVTVVAQTRLGATLRADFQPSATGSTDFFLEHPDYLFGRRNFSQTVRFCPRPVSAGEEAPGEPDVADLFDGSRAAGVEMGLCPCRRDGTCGPGCTCACHPPIEPEGEVDAGMASVAYTNALEVAATNELPGILRLHVSPPERRRVPVTIDPERVAGCICACPEHAGDGVSLAYLSRRLVAVDGDGAPFVVARASTNVFLAGAWPSESVGDATAAFARNGRVESRYDLTVLGLAIRHRTRDLASINALDPRGGFGVPTVMGTNRLEALELLLRTDVDLPFGTVRLALEGTNGTVRVWRRRGETDEVLLDAAGRRELHLPLTAWKALVAETGPGRDLPVRVTATEAGAFRLAFGYAGIAPDGQAVTCGVAQVVTVVNPPLLPDYDRDGVVDGMDVRAYVDGRRLYFWANDDIWRGDDAFAGGVRIGEPVDLPTNGVDGVVNGRNDLVNLCPLAVDLGAFVEAWGTNRVDFEFYAAQAPRLRFVPLASGWNDVRAFVRFDRMTPGGPLHDARLLSEGDGIDEDVGYRLSDTFAGQTRRKSGVFAVEFPDAGNPELHLRIRRRGTDEVLFESVFHVVVLPIDSMYRWVNLVDVCEGPSPGPEFATRTDEPAWPDTEHADANVVFVHGYNMAFHEGREWARTLFKRLWWAGVDAGFTAVLWRGNSSQMWLPIESCYMTRDFHQNVLNAFRTAGPFKTAMDGLPGARKYYIAHSLGNMLVSAAKQDHGLVYTRYFMLNAAVPVEAYDPDGVTPLSKACMTPPSWRPFSDRVRATHWNELFPTNDARYGLTWKGRFGDVDRAVNFFSSEDEVVADGDGKFKNPFSRKFAWYNQERYRGLYLVSFSPEAGWSFGPYLKNGIIGYVRDGEPIYGLRRYTPTEADEISDPRLISVPFFKRFQHPELCSETGDAYLHAHPEYRFRLLSHGIPAESFAVGCTPVPRWETIEKEVVGQIVRKKPMLAPTTSYNVDMATSCCLEEDKTDNWIHSYFIGVPFSKTQRLWDLVSRMINQTPKGK